MREILFRGKDIDSGEWVQGYYTLYAQTRGLLPCILTGTEHGCVLPKFVDPETVGQYTGLKDKNRRKIYEGDIVKCTDETNDYSFTAVVMFGNPNGEYNWGFQLKRIKGANANTDILLWVEMEDTGAYIEVIGNIHDNPELLKGE